MDSESIQEAGMLACMRFKRKLQQVTKAAVSGTVHRAIVNAAQTQGQHEAGLDGDVQMPASQPVG